MSSGTQLSGFIRALEGLDPQEVRQIMVASVCVIAIECQCDPDQILSSLESALAGEWDGIKEAILIRQFEEQMEIAI